MRWRIILASGAAVLMALGLSYGFGPKLEFNGGEVYQAPAATADEATKLGQYLVKDGFFDGSRKSVELGKTDKAYQFRVVVAKGADQSKEYLGMAKVMAGRLSKNVFDAAPVEFHFCDEQLKTLATVPPLSGLEFPGGELFFTEAIPKEEAVKVGNYLVKEGLFGKDRISVLLHKSGNNYQFNMVMKKGAQDDEQNVAMAQVIAGRLSRNLFNGAPVEFNCCDDWFSVTKKLGPVAGLEFKGGELFYTPSVSKEEAQNLGEQLVKDEYFDGQPKSVQLDKVGDTYQFRMVVKAGVDKDPQYANMAKQVAEQFSKNLFKSAPVEVHFCDSWLKTTKVIGPESGK